MKMQQNDWQLAIWQALYEADGKIIDFSKILELNEVKLEGYLIHDFYNYLKDKKYILGHNFSQARITPEGKGHYLATMQPQNSITERDVLDIIYKSSLANTKFKIGLTEMDCTVQYLDTDMYFTWKKGLDGNYEIGWNPATGKPLKNIKEPLTTLTTWLSLVEKEVEIEKSKTKKSKATKNQNFKHALSTDKSDANLLSKGYSNQGLIGYISKIKGSSRTALYSAYVNNTEDYINFIEEEDDTFKSLSTDLNVLGYVEHNKDENTLELEKFFSEASFNHLYCTKPNKRKIKELGFEKEIFTGVKNIYLTTKPNNENIPLFVYSSQPEQLLFEPLKAIIEEEFETKADILPDTIAIKDELGRKGLMEILFERINKLWSKLRENESYTVLINGEWGSGKSSMLLYLEEEFTKNKWTIVKYNAWENQRFDEPWWILVNKVSKEVPRKAFDPKNPYKSNSHWFWKNKLQYSIVIIVVLLIFFLVAIGIHYKLIIKEDIKYYASIIALIGSVWVIVNGTVQFLFRKKAYSVLQSNTANDPFESVKKRFSTVLKHKRVAIFIDDLDRCEVEPTVKLLEGIQTLFKNSKVLYVIAADGKWVANCFDKKYEDFKELVESGQTIGNEFLQKNFQLIVDVPKISNIQQIALLNKYLDKKDDNIGQSQEENISEDKFKDELSTKTNVEDIAKLSANKGASFRKIAAEQVEKLIEVDKRHYTQKLQELGLIPPNPRQMKRLINLFTLKVQVLIIAGTLQEIGEENILRYVLFASEYPAFDQQLRKGITENFTPEAKEILGDGITSEKVRTFM